MHCGRNSGQVSAVITSVARLAEEVVRRAYEAMSDGDALGELGLSDSVNTP